MSELFRGFRPKNLLLRQNLGTMPLTIRVAHDFICPWCWVGLFQAQRLQDEFGVRIDWKGYELFPEDLEWPDHPSLPKPYTNRPATPSRLEFLLAADAIELPHVERPHKMRTYNAHQALEFAKTEGVQDRFIEVLYRAYWERGENINDVHVLKKLAHGVVDDVDGLVRAVEKRKFKSEIVNFDDDAHAKGVFNVPTFFIGGQRLAEQPYSVLRKALHQALEAGPAGEVYAELNFPVLSDDRPYVFIDMVTTIDGKILSGSRDESVHDLGSKLDHQILDRLEAAADAILIGAQTLRATPKQWNPHTEKRIVLTKSGNLPADSAFLTGGKAYVATSGSASISVPHGASILRAGGERLDFGLLLSRIKALGVKRLLVLGGSELNGQLLQHDLVDELFLTITPKVKLGRDVPTYAGGEALPRESLRRFHLVENHAVSDEVFLRYRREHSK